MNAKTSLTIAAIMTLIASLPAVASPPTLQVGKPFPGLALPALKDGRPVTLADFRGKKVILHVFASW